MGTETTDRNNDSRSEGTGGGKVPTEEVLTVFERQSDRARPLTANDIMDEVGCSRRTAHNKLDELVERDLLKTRKTGARSRVWWMPMEQPPDPEPPGEHRAPESVQHAVQEIELPGRGDLLEARRDAVLAAFLYLRANPQAKKADFQREVYPDQPAGYESPESWWNAIQPALKKVPGIDPPEEREHLWHFLGG